MLKHVSHSSGVLAEGEILFDTHFGYMFDHLCREKDCLLPRGPQTVSDLLKLGEIMITPKTETEAEKKSGLMLDDNSEELESKTPSVFTFLGQFIDHDITARTDRNGNVTNISNPDGTATHIEPTDPDFVVKHLKNGRRPQLDLDSVFGDGPSFLGSTYTTEADVFYEGDLSLKIQDDDGYFDLPRKKDGDGLKVKLRNCAALIADARNDENLNLSQLHAVFLAAYNRIYASSPGSPREKYIYARKILRWIYQFIVIDDYLPRVCMKDIVADTLINGPYYYNLSKGIFMPLEFSVAGFRFGHSMIRQDFQVNEDKKLSITELLNFRTKDGEKLIDEKECRLKKEFIIDWSFYVDGGDNKARKIDPKIVEGLFSLGDRPPTHVLAKLTQRNLLRGYSLSIPTGQSVAKAMQTQPLSTEQILENSKFGPEDKDFLLTSGFTHKTPLWFYILQEAYAHTGGNTLGVVGSRLVAETLIGLVKYDPNSYLNNLDHDSVIHENGKVKGILVPDRPRNPINYMEELINYAKA